MDHLFNLKLTYTKNESDALLQLCMHAKVHACISAWLHHETLSSSAEFGLNGLSSADKLVSIDEDDGHDSAWEEKEHKPAYGVCYE